MRLAVRMTGRPELLRRIEKQAAFAASRAVNTVAGKVKDDIEAALPKVFDRPVAYTLRGVFRTYARKQAPRAKVGMKRRQAEYLALQATGGIRRPRGRALLAPAGVRLNRAGNIPRGGVRRLLARSDTFSGRINGQGGIWQRRRDGRLVLLVTFSERQTYRARFDLPGIARKSVHRHGGAAVREAWSYALKTAR